MSGYNYGEYVLRVRGEVVMGNQIGRKFGIPTINVPANDLINLPQYGVYTATITITDDEDMSEGGTGTQPHIYEGVANLGVKPTIYNEAGENPVCIEVNLFDFAGDLYNAKVEVTLYSFLRQEKKFADVEELMSQIRRDIDTAKEYFGHIQ